MHVEDLLIDFRGAFDPPAYTAPDGGRWVQRTVETGGSPTVAADGDGMKLYLDTTAEAQQACLYMLDKLVFDIDDIQQVDIWAKLSSASIHPALSGAFGLVSAWQADPDNIAAAMLFRFLGSNAIYCESDDGTNDNDDKSTGLNLSTTFKRFTIDLASGIKTVIPPPSSGGKGNVLFSMDDDNLNLRQVCRGTRFNMENYSSGLQLYAMIRKSAVSSVVDTSATGSLWIQKMRIRYKSS